MKKISTLIMLSTTLLALPNTQIKANQPAEKTTNNIEKTEVSKKENTKQQTKPFTSFTGKVTKNKVRMRLQPGLDSPIIRQLDQGDMVIVVDEDDDFFSIQPPEDLKAYIFRTYVLDGNVEGHHVNVRLDPVLDSPVIAQLNSGDPITGRISPLNSKWLEITPPQTTKFFVSKDYIEKIGDASYLAKVNKRRDSVNQLLDSAYSMSQSSIHIPFNEIDFDEIISKYQSVINDYPEFENQNARAKELAADFKEAYTKKKIAYLENKSKEFQNADALKQENTRLTKAVQRQEMRLKEIETGNTSVDRSPNQDLVSQWSPKENAIYQEWLYDNVNGTKEEFYEDEIANAATIRGRIEPYTRNVKNKPGDYVLLSSDNTPIYFLYSTKINLGDLIGREVTMKATRRPHNNFAYPAYFVLTIE